MATKWSKTPNYTRQQQRNPYWPYLRNKKHMAFEPCESCYPAKPKVSLVFIAPWNKKKKHSSHKIQKRLKIAAIIKTKAKAWLGDIVGGSWEIGGWTEGAGGEPALTKEISSEANGRTERDETERKEAKGEKRRRRRQRSENVRNNSVSIKNKIHSHTHTHIQP